MSLGVAVAGARGRMGTLILEEIRSAGDIQIVSAFDLVGAGELADGVLVSKPEDMQAVLRETDPDVLIDFTNPASSVSSVAVASALGVNLVVGTTGFSSDQHAAMKKSIEGRIAAVISPNFSLGVNLFWRLVEQAARALNDYDMEVIEAHHNQKKDAPSGTAVKTVDILKEATGISSVVHGRHGMAPRGREIGVHAVRAGDIVGDHTVLMSGHGERIEIRHQAHSRSAFATGAVRAARWVSKASPGIYSMYDVLWGT